MVLLSVLCSTDNWQELGAHRVPGTILFGLKNPECLRVAIASFIIPEKPSISAFNGVLDGGWDSFWRNIHFQQELAQEIAFERKHKLSGKLLLLGDRDAPIIPKWPTMCASDSDSGN